jgi:hypothetical protein
MKLTLNLIRIEIIFFFQQNISEAKKNPELTSVRKKSIDSYNILLS